jgi:uncharacterized membrane protein
MGAGTTVRREHRCRAPLAQTFAYVDDHRHVPEWMFGVEQFDPVGDLEHGLGSVFDVVVHVGLPIRSRIETVAWEQDRLIEFASVKGFKTESVWTFEALDESTTLIVSEVTYHLPFGPAGRVMGKVMEPAVGKVVDRSSEALVRKVEEYAARG